MPSKWSNRQGSRDRQAVAVLVTEDGLVHQFTGAAISNVCAVVIAGQEKAGKWSYTEYQINHRPSTVFIGWMEDFELGLAWPQQSWDQGFSWLAEKAPGLSLSGFTAYIRKTWPKTAARWDLAAEADAEFDDSLPLIHGVETAKTVEEMKAAAAAARREADDLKQATDDLERANKELLQVKARHYAAQQESARLGAETAERMKTSPFASLAGKF